MPADRYGETPVDPEEQAAFVTGLRVNTKLELDELEGLALERVWRQKAEQLLEARIDLDDLTQSEALVDLHREALHRIWVWAGQVRTRQTSIGRPAALIRNELYEAMGTVRFLADQTDMPPLEVAARAHHLLVRIHPFVDVNGRISRLYADLVMLALTGDCVLDWSAADIDKRAYVTALRKADATGDVGDLVLILDERPLGLNG